MKDGGNRSHNPRENLGRGRQTEIKDPELVCLSLHHESKVATRIAMNRNLQVGVLQVQGDHPVTWTDGAKDRLWSFHVEVKRGDVIVQGRQFYDGTPRPRSLLDEEQTAVETRRLGGLV